MKPMTEGAVSPVVGVMLMLVVTIIIAAVVSAFAGGMSTSQKSVPQVTLKVTYSQSDGMRLEHNGGDVLSTQGVNLILRHAETMGSSHESWTTVVNKSIIQNTPSNPTKYWVNATYAGVEVPRWSPGETMYITREKCMPTYLEPELHAYKYSPAGPAGVFDGTYAISAPGQIGATFYIELVTTDGKQIAQVEVPITA